MECVQPFIYLASPGKVFLEATLTSRALAGTYLAK
jgi:hypothetical protein